MGYDQFPALKEAVWRAAIDKAMEFEGFYGNTHDGYDRYDNFDEKTTGRLPPVKGPTGEVTLTIETQDNPLMPPSTSYLTLDPWKDYYQPWIQRIDQAFEGWDQLPDPGGFDKLITPLQTTVTNLTFSTGDTQTGGSTTGNKDLVGDFSAMRTDLDPHGDDDESSQAISAFTRRYGPDVLELVIGNLKQAVIVLGLAQQGEKQLWTKARDDVATLADNAAKAFKDAGPSNDPFAICSAFLGLVGAFVPPAAAVTGAIDAGLGFVQAVKPPDKGAEVSPDLKGGSPDDVYNNLCDSIKKLNTTVFNREDELRTMLKSMFDKMNSDDKDFTLCVDRGLDPEVKNLGKIKVDTGLMKTIGFSLMPDIAAVISDAVPDLETADSSLPWMRPWNIGYGSTGPWDEYFYLNLLVSGAISSNANQIVLAGKALAAAAGYLKDTDGAGKVAMTRLRKNLTDSETGWPQVDDDPPPYVPGPNGKMMPN